MTFKRVVNAVQVLALLAAAAFVVLLFVNRPTAPVTAAPAAGGAVDGAAVFSAHCTGCHGAHGEGGVGPKLAGGRVVTAFPDAASQVAFVKRGSGAMPSWEGRLTPAEIDAVVAYTRALPEP